MRNEEIYFLIKKFRRAIENARDNGMFERDATFNYFPKSCCRDASLLLAEYLSQQNIKTVYVWGTDNVGQTHGWLVLKDQRLNGPMVHNVVIPDTISEILHRYSNNKIDVIENIYYEETDIINGLIIDITADQFNNIPIYVGEINNVYSEFLFESACEYNYLGNDRLRRLYQIITNYL